MADGEFSLALHGIGVLGFVVLPDRREQRLPSAADFGVPVHLQQHRQIHGKAGGFGMAIHQAVHRHVSENHARTFRENCAKKTEAVTNENGQPVPVCRSRLALPNDHPVRAAKNHL